MMHPKHTRHYQSLRSMIDARLGALVTKRKPEALTDALRYVLNGGGKRVRSTLLLLACESVGGPTKSALDVAVAVELMHDFTLVHDDIMDHAASRRGRPTVHIKWDTNNALLVGDTLLGIAYGSLLHAKAENLPRVLRLFTQGLLDVCEGQAFDLAFECSVKVTLPEYFGMIEKKTAALMAMSAELGGVVGGGSAKETKALRAFGLHLGRAFQIQDDLLDVVADQKNFGKVIGGDILEGKKTFLLIEAAARARGRDRRVLRQVLDRNLNHGAARSRRDDLVGEVTRIYHKYGVIDSARAQVGRDTLKATAALETLAPTRGTESLAWFASMLLQRKS